MFCTYKLTRNKETRKEKNRIIVTLPKLLADNCV